MTKQTKRQMTPQECVEYAVEQSRDLPEPLRLRVYWGTLIALAVHQPQIEGER